MDDITGVYGGHHYINNHPLDDERFYPWFLSKLQWGANMAQRKGKNFILGEFGPKQDGRVVDGIKRDTCVYWDTSQEPLVGIQMAEAVIAGLNAGIYALAYWTFMDFPDDYSNTYINKWGIFKWSGNDYSPRAHYYAYGLLTKFFRGPATVFRVDCDDPYVRVGAVRHQETNTYSIAVVNRYKGDVPVEFKLKNEPVNTEFRKYVYDPENVKINPFGDLQEPVGKVAMRDGRMTDTLKQGTLTVYTTAYDEESPGPVQDLKIERTFNGKVRLTWRPNLESGLCYYRIYRSNKPDFVPSVESQIGTTVATEFLDENPSNERYYKVVAVDDSGNTFQGK